MVSFSCMVRLGGQNHFQWACHSWRMSFRQRQLLTRMHADSLLWQFCPGGSTRSAYWILSSLCIHSFPRGQVLSLWWMGAATGQLFSLDGTSLTSSELKRPPLSEEHRRCYESRVALAVILTRTQTRSHHLPPLWLFLLESTWGKGGCLLDFHLHGCMSASCQVDIMESTQALQVSAEGVTLVHVCTQRCEASVAAVLHSDNREN